MPSQKTARVAKNTGFLFLRMTITVGISLYTSREILHILGVKDFGIYNLVGTIVVMFTFLQTALTHATSRFIAYDLGCGKQEKLQKTFSMSINTECALALIILFLSEAIGPWFIGHKLNIPNERINIAQWVFQISLLNFIINIIKTPFNAVIIAYEKMEYYAYTSIVEALCKLLIVYTLLIIPFDKLVIYAILQTLVTVIVFIWMFFYSQRHFSECKYRYYWDWGLLKKLLNYSGLSLLVDVVDIAVIQSISIFFNIFSGVIANAALAISNQVNAQLVSFLNNFSQSYYPQIIKSYAEKDYTYFMNLIFSASKFSYFLYFGIAFPIIINIKYLLRIWLTTPPLQTEFFLCLIIGYNIFDSFSQPLWGSVHATGKLKTHQLLMGGIKSLNIPVSYLLLKLGYPIISVLCVYMILNII